MRNGCGAVDVSDVSDQNAGEQNQDPTPVRGEDAQFSITKRHSDFFAKNVRLRAQMVERVFNSLHWLS
jgi:hypothetical protein